MKLSKKQQKIQQKINQLLLAGIPLATLIPFQAVAQNKEAAPGLRGIPPKSPVKVEAKIETQIHVVRSGETMFKIAKLYNTTVKELCRLNRIPEKDAGKIYPKQKLIVPKPTHNRVQEKPTEMIVGIVAAKDEPKNSVQEDKKAKPIPGKIRLR